MEISEAHVHMLLSLLGMDHYKRSACWPIKDTERERQERKTQGGEFRRVKEDRERERKKEREKERERVKKETKETQWMLQLTEFVQRAKRCLVHVLLAHTSQGLGDIHLDV